MAWQFELATDIGSREEQQDRAVILTSADGCGQLVVLADGLGGHRDGASAAQMVVDVARREFAHAPINEPARFLTDVCVRAHRAISQLGSGTRSNPASTCVLLYVRDDEAYWAHVGDSRLYHFRGERLLYRTRDHSVAEIRGIAAGDSRSRPSDQQNRLYMCLGGQNDLIPEFGAAAVEADDWFLLCTDGFWSQVGPDETSRAFLQMAGSRVDAARVLSALAAARGGTSADNVSLVLARRRPELTAAYWQRMARWFWPIGTRRSTS